MVSSAPKVDEGQRSGQRGNGREPSSISDMLQAQFEIFKACQRRGDAIAERKMEGTMTRRRFALDEVTWGEILAART